MPLTRIKQTAIGEDSVTSAKLAHDLDFDGQFVRVPHGTTAQRPSNPVAGQLRFNTDLGTLEQYNTNTNNWAAIDSPPIINSLTYTGSGQNATDPAGGETITLTGSNFKNGFTLTVGGTTVGTTAFVDSTRVTFTAPAKTAGDYDVVLTNANGLAATLTSGISYNGVPAFTTAAGNIGTLEPDAAMSTVTIVAAEPDGGTVSYSVTTGAVPTGTSLSSAGAITGTPSGSGLTGNTTSTFTVTATDNEGQTSTRQFNLIVLRPIYTKTINNSLAFVTNRDVRLEYTPGSNGDDRTKFTLSTWVKRSHLGYKAGATRDYIFSALDPNGSGHASIHFSGDDGITFNTASIGEYTSTNTILQETASWYHLHVNIDTNASAGSRVRMWINGQEIAMTVSVEVTAGVSLPYFENAKKMFIGAIATSSGAADTADMMLADTYIVDGKILAPTLFAESVSNTWVAKPTYTGSLGTMGAHLEYGNLSNLGEDTTSSNNNWTWDDDGSGPDSSNQNVYRMVDTPTNSFNTLSMQNNNLQWHSGSEYISRCGLFSYSSSGSPSVQAYANYATGDGYRGTGKWYWEVKLNNYSSGTNAYIGVVPVGRDDHEYSGVSWNDGLFFHQSTGRYDPIGTYTSSGGLNFGTGDYISLMFDHSTGVLSAWLNGGTTGAADYTFTAYPTIKGWLPYHTNSVGSGNAGFAWNFGGNPCFGFLDARPATVYSDANGNGEFKYQVPTGALALCTANFSEATDMKQVRDEGPDKHFNTVSYEGTGSTQSITGMGFKPSWLWIKDVDTDTGSGNGYNWQMVLPVVDQSEGVLLPSATNTLYNTANMYYNSIDIDGFTVPGAVGINANGATHHAYGFNMGNPVTVNNVAGAGAVPTAGSVVIDGVNKTTAQPNTAIKRQIVNTSMGISITRFTDGGGAHTIDHNLGVKPDLVIMKNLSGNAETWFYLFDVLDGSNDYFTTGNSGSETVVQNTGGSYTTTYTSTSFFLDSQQTGQDYVCIAIASKPGFSRVGRYDGNSSPDGVFIHTGFRPGMVMVKNLSATSVIRLRDNIHQPLNRTNLPTVDFSRNAPALTGSNRDMYFHSNGFKLKVNSSTSNNNNNAYWYMAFADQGAKFGNGK